MFFFSGKKRNITTRATIFPAMHISLVCWITVITSVFKLLSDDIPGHARSTWGDLHKYILSYVEKLLVSDYLQNCGIPICLSNIFFFLNRLSSWNICLILAYYVNSLHVALNKNIAKLVGKINKEFLLLYLNALQVFFFFLYLRIGSGYAYARESNFRCHISQSISTQY